MNINRIYLLKNAKVWNFVLRLFVLLRLLVSMLVSQICDPFIHSLPLSILTVIWIWVKSSNLQFLNPMLIYLIEVSLKTWKWPFNPTEEWNEWNIPEILTIGYLVSWVDSQWLKYRNFIFQTAYASVLLDNNSNDLSF